MLSSLPPQTKEWKIIFSIETFYCVFDQNIALIYQCCPQVKARKLSLINSIGRHQESIISTTYFWSNYGGI